MKNTWEQYGIPESLNVKGSLDLRGTGITALPDNLTVGGWLDLSGTGITALPDNLTVGGSLYLRGTGITEKTAAKVNRKVPEIHVFRQAQKGNGWIYVDGRLTHVKDIERKIGDYTFIVGKIPGLNLITDGTHWAHCDTIRNGIIDLRFKAADRDKSDYEGLTLDSVISYEDAVVMYRVITGACQAGTQAFLNTLTKEQIRDKYTIREIIDITAGQYNSDSFNRFFNKE